MKEPVLSDECASAPVRNTWRCKKRPGGVVLGDHPTGSEDDI
jgi:hypothetical protein